MGEEIKKGYDYKDKFFEIVGNRKQSGEEKLKDKFVKEVSQNGGADNFKGQFQRFCNAFSHNTRFFLYKAFSNGFDCDVAEGVMKELAILLPNNVNPYAIVNQGNTGYKYQIFAMQNGIQRTYRGDTMNSFWPIFKQFLQQCLKQELGLVFNKHTGNYCVPKNNRIFKSKAKNNNLKNWFYHIIMNHQNIEDNPILELFEKFAHLTHTIGNFFLVPSVPHYSYNLARYQKFNDCFDLTLDDIHKVFKKEIHGGIITADIHYWPESYVDFPDFVTQNCLQMYVDGQYHVRSLLSKKAENDPLRKGTKLTERDEFECYLVNVIEKIQARNEIINRTITENEMNRG